MLVVPKGPVISCDLFSYLLIAIIFQICDGTKLS